MWVRGSSLYRLIIKQTQSPPSDARGLKFYADCADASRWSSAPRGTVDSKEAPLNVEGTSSKQTAHNSKNRLSFVSAEGYSKDEKRWPLILYLHGKSLRGSDLEMLKSYGLASLLAKDLAIRSWGFAAMPDDRYWMTEYER